MIKFFRQRREQLEKQIEEQRKKEFIGRLRIGSNYGKKQRTKPPVR